MPKEKIVLSIDGDNIYWIDKSKSNLVDSFYHIYNDTFLVKKITDQSYTLSDEKLIDEAGPSKIKKVNIVYKGDMVTFDWEEVEDLGTDNILKINLYDKNDKLKAFSNTVKKNYSSGISKYIVEFKGENFEVWDNKFSIKLSDLKDGITNIRLYGIDNRGNKGVVSSIPLYNYKVILSRENDLLRFSIDDDTQKYSFKVFVNGKDSGYITSNPELNTLLVDKSAPNAPKDVKITSSDKITNIRWSECEDVGSTYKVKIIASGLSYYNNATSDETSIEKKSDIKGYYYAINKLKNYKVTDKDIFTIKTDVDYVDDYGVYYFHIATIDNNGNISGTKTYKFEKIDKSLIVDNSGNDVSDNNNNNDNKPGSGNVEVKPPTSTAPPIVDAVETSIRGLIKRVGSVSEESYKKAISIVKVMPKSVIDYMVNKDINIYITTGEAESLYKSFTGKDSDKSITGAFVWGSSTTAVICESAYMDSTLLHELGHAFDYISGNGNFISESESFNNIFNTEKNYIFKDGEYASSSENEYFAESFAMYYNDNGTLKNKAPLTYSFIEKYLK